MSHYRKVDVRIWNDKKFNELSADAKLVFFQLLTHPNLLPIGAMRSSIYVLAGDLQWTVDRMSSAFGEISIRKMVIYFEPASFIWLPNFLKYNKPESPNVVKSWRSYPDYLPECEMKDMFLLALNDWVRAMTSPYQEAFKEAFPDSLSNQEHKQEQEQKQYQDKEKHFSPEKLILHSKKEESCPKSKVDFKEDAMLILNFLNMKAEKNFEPTVSNLENIIRRLEEGASLEICRAITMKKVRHWKSDVKMNFHLNPKTIFKKDNFERYRGDLVEAKDD